MEEGRKNLTDEERKSICVEIWTEMGLLPWSHKACHDIETQQTKRILELQTELTKKDAENNHINEGYTRQILRLELELRNIKKYHESNQSKSPDFAQVLADKLSTPLLKATRVDEITLSDLSGRSVEMRIGDKVLCFSFDMTGEVIDRLFVLKDVIEVVDTVKIFGE